MLRISLLINLFPKLLSEDEDYDSLKQSNNNDAIATLAMVAFAKFPSESEAGKFILFSLIVAQVIEVALHGSQSRPIPSTAPNPTNDHPWSRHTTSKSPCKVMELSIWLPPVSPVRVLSKRSTKTFPRLWSHLALTSLLGANHARRLES
ncbi:hypothetical protein BKA56DRAFT_617996 [Ilyonectria sp. MPI-CAGE-AT-0026]|nr:hypothetical protein BKA56DRAFT_617996 [Ilyonectria sp. MPI-CAGE-AT-0026]